MLSDACVPSAKLVGARCTQPASDVKLGLRVGALHGRLRTRRLRCACVWPSERNLSKQRCVTPTAGFSVVFPKTLSGESVRGVALLSFRAHSGAEPCACREWRLLSQWFTVSRFGDACTTLRVLGFLWLIQTCREHTFVREPMVFVSLFLFCISTAASKQTCETSTIATELS